MLLFFCVCLSVFSCFAAEKAPVEPRSFLLCQSTDESLEAGWAAFENGDYTAALQKFSKAANKYRYDWNKGYAQECQVLRYLYFTGEIPQEQFFAEIKNVYDIWYTHNPADTAHLVPYAVVLFLQMNKNQSISILEKVYKERWNYNFETPSVEDMYNFFAGAVIGRLKKEMYENTVYAFLFDLPEEEMINIFVGN